MEYLDETHPNPPILPKDPRGRARVRALAAIVAADSHPLMVPRVRNFMEHELKLDEPTRNRWIRHWIGEGLAAMEGHLSRDKETGKFAHGDSRDDGGHLPGQPGMIGARLLRGRHLALSDRRSASPKPAWRSTRSRGASAEAARRAGESRSLI